MSLSVLLPCPSRSVHERRRVLGLLSLPIPEAWSLMGEMGRMEEMQRQGSVAVATLADARVSFHTLPRRGTAEWHPALEPVASLVRARQTESRLVPPELASLLPPALSVSEMLTLRPDSVRWTRFSAGRRSMWGTPYIHRHLLLEAVVHQTPPGERLALWREMAPRWPRFALAWLDGLPAPLGAGGERVEAPALHRQDFAPLLGSEDGDIRLRALLACSEREGRQASKQRARQGEGRTR